MSGNYSMSKYRTGEHALALTGQVNIYIQERDPPQLAYYSLTCIVSIHVLSQFDYSIYFANLLVTLTLYQIGWHKMVLVICIFLITKWF